MKERRGDLRRQICICERVCVCVHFRDCDFCPLGLLPLNQMICVEQGVLPADMHKPYKVTLYRQWVKALQMQGEKRGRDSLKQMFTASAILFVRIRHWIVEYTEDYRHSSATRVNVNVKKKRKEDAFYNLLHNEIHHPSEKCQKRQGGMRMY